MTESRFAQSGATPHVTPRAVRTAALHTLAAAALASGLAGCGSLNTLSDGNLVAAAPLCEDISDPAVPAKGTTCSHPEAPPFKPDPADPNKIKEWLGDVINESEHNCERFVNGLVLTSTSTNVGLDSLTTLFTALGTAFTPLGTVHALSAGGAVSSGWKTAIDADVYAKATIANYAQAITASYYTDLQNYLDDLKASDETKLIWSIELGKIRTIHKECSLASAQQVISATVQTPTPPKPPTPPAPPPAAAAAPAAPPAAAPAPPAPAAGRATPASPAQVFTRSVIPGHAVR